jgi:hypothetical protein
MKKSVFMALAAVLVLSADVFADDALSIVKKSCDLTPPDYSQTVFEADLIDKNGNVTERRDIRQYGNRKNDIVSTVFDIRTPASVKDTRILQAEKKGKSDDKWIYLPSLKTTRRIAAAERQKSWVGTDFTYNDMTIRKAEDDTHEMLSENAKVKSNETEVACWQIKSVPLVNKNVEFAYRIVFYEKVSYLPVRIEYYDKKDTLFKTQCIEKFAKVQGETGKSYWIRQQVRTTNVETGHSTLVKIIKQVLDKEISDRYFTQNWLNTGK